MCSTKPKCSEEMGAMIKALMTIAAIVMIFTKAAMAASFTVGGPNGGWDLSTNLQAWASSQTFSPGDTLTFTYAPFHDVMEVSKPDFDACQTSNPLSTYSDGSTTIALSTAGTRYFICGSPTHCLTGMKVAIRTVAASSSAAAADAPAPLALHHSSPLSSFVTATAPGNGQSVTSPGISRESGAATPEQSGARSFGMLKTMAVISVGIFMQLLIINL